MPWATQDGARWRGTGTACRSWGPSLPSLGLPNSITRERTEIILQGTASPNASAPDAIWEDYEFKCKPGDLRRRPCLISPYHHRLDWLMWFAAFQVRALLPPPPAHYPLTLHGQMLMLDTGSGHSSVPEAVMPSVETAGAPETPASGLVVEAGA